MFVLQVPERACVVVESRFKCALCVSNVGFFLLVVFSHYCGLVHNAFCQTLAVEGAGVFLTAIALLDGICRAFRLLLEVLVVMRCDDILYVRHAAVA